MEFADLGPLEVHGTPTPARLGRRGALALGALLWADRPVDVDRLTDIVWGDDQPTDPRESLHVLIWRLRRVLEPARDRGAPPSLLVSTPTGYVLLAHTDNVHSRSLERALGDARAAFSTGDPRSALRTIDDGLAKWRGHPLGELGYEPWARPHAAQLIDIRIGALELRLDALHALGQDHDVVRATEALVADHPTREGFWARRATALYRIGDQAAALRTLHAVRRYLAEELGVQPGPELVALERRVLEQDPTLVDGPGATRPTVGVVVRRHRPVPRLRSTYIGRDAETTLVQDLLARRNLVTLSGPGGVGKTRLAIEAARASAPAFDGGAAFVDLARAASSADVAAVVAEDLGVDAATRLDDPGSPLAPVELLVVLDGCEHVLAGATAMVAALAHLDGVSVLVTSRVPLGADGERLVPVAPLAVPPARATAAVRRRSPAVRLLRDRATAAGAELPDDAGTVAALAELAARLDGLPLALELAGSALATFTTADLMHRLDHGVDLPVPPGVGRPDRHQSIDACIAASYDTVAPVDHELLACLSVVDGPFDLTTAQHVGISPVVPEADVAPRLANLVHTSLVLHDADPAQTTSYRMLETVRAFVQRRSAPAVLDEARQRLSGATRAS